MIPTHELYLGARALWWHCRTKSERANNTRWEDLTPDQRKAWYPQAVACLEAARGNVVSHETDDTDRPAIWYMNMNMYQAVDGPFYSIEEIPPGCWAFVDEDPDFQFQVWRPSQVDLNLRDPKDCYWREEYDE